MALIHADFPSGQTGLYGTTETFLLDGVYAEYSEAVLVEDPDPNVTGTVLRLDTDTGTAENGRIRKVLPSSVTEVGVGMRVYLPGLPNNNAKRPEPISLRNGSNTPLCSIVLNTDGYISAYRGMASSGTLLGTSTNPAVVANAWQHVEAKFVLSDTVGTIEVRVDGVEVLNLTGLDNLNAAGPCTQFNIQVNQQSAQAYSYYVKDLIVWDTAGSVNNDFLGSVSVVQLIPDGDVSLTWTPTGSATGFGAVDESPPDDATTYISAADPPPAADTMTLTDLPADVTSVKGLIVITRSQKSDGGDGNLQMGLISGASTGLGSDRPMTTAYTYWNDIFELDPDTSAAWLPAAVNAVTLRFDRTT